MARCSEHPLEQAHSQRESGSGLWTHRPAAGKRDRDPVQQQSSEPRAIRRKPNQPRERTALPAENLGRHRPEADSGALQALEGMVRPAWAWRRRSRCCACSRFIVEVDWACKHRQHPSCGEEHHQPLCATRNLAHLVCQHVSTNGYDPGAYASRFPTAQRHSTVADRQ